MEIVLIVAMAARTRAIGHNNKLLWRLPSDVARFKRVTTGHPVIMGRKTWESIPQKFRPLPDRTNIVVTRNHDYEALGAQVAFSLSDALVGARISPGWQRIYVIGGGELYEEALAYAHEIDMTLVASDTDGNVKFPVFEHLFKQVTVSSVPIEENGVTYSFVTFRRK